jgi:flagellar L-ring protein precursor FlgH
MAGKIAVRSVAVVALAVVTATLTASVAVAQSKGKPPPKPADNYDELLTRYLQQARGEVPANAKNTWAWLNGLSLDRRARQVNDLITIRVVEAITASGSADSQLSKDSNAGAGVATLFGLEKKLPGSIDSAALFGTKSSSTFKGAGTTTRAGDFTAALTARVVEVLPNGDLVVEGVHELDINGDQQVIVLTGVVRVSDVSPNNVVSSQSIGQMRVRYFGRGLMKDNLKPGILIRLLNKIF